MRSTFLIILLPVLLSLAGIDVTSKPSVTIDSPQDGDVFTAKTVTFSGNATGSDGRWFQGSQTAFNAGTKESVVVTSSGTVQLSKGVSDDFDDNSLNTTLWTKEVANGLTFTEDGGVLNISGTASGSPWDYTAYTIARSNLEVDFFVSARLLSFSGSGAGYRTHILLCEDLSNYVQIGQRYDEDVYGKRVLEWGYVTGGTDTTTSLGDALSGEHTYNITYSGGTAKVFQDGVEKAKATIALSDMTVWVVSLVKDDGDKVAARWDNVSCGRASPGTFTSSVHDTRSTPPVLRHVDWNNTTVTNTAVSLDVRSSDSSDMGSPTAWTAVSKGQSSGLPQTKRYMQWRASLSTTDGIATPELLNVTLRYNKPISKVELSTDDMATWVRATGKSAWYKALDLPEDTTRVWVKVTDAAGDTALSHVTVTVDTTPPTGSVIVNDDAPFTGEQAVTLLLQASDRYGVAEMMLSDQVDFTGALWTNFTSTMDWTLPAGDGIKAVYAIFKDEHGLISSIMNDTIVLDTESPVGSVLIDDDAVYTNVTDVTLALSATDLTGTTEMCLSESPSFDGAEWVAYADTTGFALQPGDGTRTVYARFRDALGHVSQTVNDTIVLDTSYPLVSLVLNGGAEFTNSLELRLDITAEDASPPTYMQVGEGAEPAWGLIEAFSRTRFLTISSGDGQRSVAVRVWDSAGNTCPPVRDGITLDTVAPVVSVRVDNGADFTADRRVEVEVDVTDANFPHVELQVGEDPELKGILFAVYQPATSIVLSHTDGLKTVYARARDEAGNLGAMVSDSIMLDTTPPVMHITVNGGADLTNDPRVTVQLSVDEASGIEFIQLDEDAYYTNTQSVPFAASMEWTLSSPDGPKALYVRAMDVAGNMGVAVSATIVLDTTAPVVTITIDGGAALTNRTTVTVELLVVDAYPGGQVELSDDPSFATAVQCDAGVPTTHVLAPGDGTKALYARATDLAGNAGAVATASIALDTTPPALAIEVDGGSAFTADKEVTVALNASDPSGVPQMAVGEEIVVQGIVAVPFASTATVTLTGADGTKVLAARVRDGAGNWCGIVTASITLDTTAPSTTLSAVHNDSTALDFLVTWAGVDNTSGVRAYDVQYRIGDGPWVDWQSGTVTTQGMLAGKAGDVYYLRARAVDVAGNTEQYSDDPKDLVRVTIEGPSEGDGASGKSMTLIIILILIVIAVVLAVGYFISRGRGTKRGK